jgi:hypothetical protein
MPLVVPASGTCHPYLSLWRYWKPVLTTVFLYVCPVTLSIFLSFWLWESVQDEHVFLYVVLLHGNVIPVYWCTVILGSFVYFIIFVYFSFIVTNIMFETASYFIHTQVYIYIYKYNWCCARNIKIVLWIPYMHGVTFWIHVHLLGSWIHLQISY